MSGRLAATGSVGTCMKYTFAIFFLKMAKNLKGMKRNWENTCFQIVFLGGGGEYTFEKF